jgi:hypothetical protein
VQNVALGGLFRGLLLPVLQILLRQRQLVFELLDLFTETAKDKALERTVETNGD